MCYCDVTLLFRPQFLALMPVPGFECTMVGIVKPLLGTKPKNSLTELENHCTKVEDWLNRKL